METSIATSQREPQVKKRVKLYQVQQELKCIAEALLTPRKGILTADESTSTIGKRLQELGMKNDADTRRRWRLLLFSTAQIEEYISGVVLIDETLHQKDDSGKLLVDHLRERCILPGIKIDSGLVPLPGSQNEVFTQGMDDLSTRLADYKQKGCEFARWRCVFKVGLNTPSHRAIISNADELARFAAICQSQKICPLIEPEVVPEGNHDIRRCEQVTETVLSFVLRALNEHHVFLEGTVLKPNMVTDGLSQSSRSHPDTVAEATVIALQRMVPPAVPGVAFSSGGQTEDEATANLKAIVCALGKKPWYLTFAFGRALQASAMRIWGGNPSNTMVAQTEFFRRAKANGDATCGLLENDRSDSDVFSPTKISTPTAIGRRESDTIVSSPTTTSKWSQFTRTETPEVTPTTSRTKPKSRKTKTKKGLFSFLKKEDSPRLSPLYTPTPTLRFSQGRDDEGDIVEPVIFMSREETPTSLPRIKQSPKFSKDTSSLPETDSPKSEKDLTTRSPSVGIAKRVAPTHNPDPNLDTLGQQPELFNEWKTAELNESLITYRSCCSEEQELVVPSEFSLRILRDFQILRGVRISDSAQLPLELALPLDSDTSIESTMIEQTSNSSRPDVSETTDN